MTMTDIVIIGAGPAGLQAADHLIANNLNVVLLERGLSVGTFFRRFPRHRTLISINKANTGLSDPETKLRYDWNSLLGHDAPLFPDVTRRYFANADLYVDYLEDYAKRLGDRICFDCDVTRIAKAAEGYTITDAQGRSWTARQIIVATGVSLPWLPEIDGLDHVELYSDFDTDPERYLNKRVLILGKGNSAFETADSLIETTQSVHVMSPNPLKLAWNTHFVGHLRAVNNNFLDTYQLKSQNAVIDAQPIRIERTEQGLQVTAAMQAAEDHQIELTYDHVIACTGFRFDASIFDDDIRPTLRHMDKFPAMGPNWECDNAPGVWFAGTIMQCRDFKKTMSGFVHGFRHNVAALCDFVTARATGAALPADTIVLDPTLAEAIVARFSTNAALFLQPGFLADVIRLDGTEAGQRHKGVPLSWAADSLLQQGRHLTLTMEFGDFGTNPMHVKRQHNAFGGAPDPFIHPVLRVWQDGELVHEAHLSDHLDADWRPLTDRDSGTGTVTRMTYTDQGGPQAPSEIALRQTRAVLEIALPAALTTAAE